MPTKYKYTTSFTYRNKRYYVRANTEAELYMRKANRIRDLQEESIDYDSNITVDQWSNIAFNTYKSDVKDLPSMKKRYQKYCSPSIGSRPIGQIKPVECQVILNACAGMSYSHVNKLRQELSFVFESAVDNQIIPTNPAKKLKMPTYNKGKRRSITDEERKHLYAVFERDPAFLLFILILKCGCRPEEAINLTGKDIDHNQRLLHIRGTKTANADRFVPISADLYNIIGNTKPNAPIAPNRAGNRHTESSYARLYARLKREMNISMGCKTYRNELVPPYPLADDFVPYCLRHTYCTDLCRAGVDVRTAQKLMGHANISITADIYTHVDIDDIKAAGKLIEAYSKKI